MYLHALKISHYRIRAGRSFCYLLIMCFFNIQYRPASLVLPSHPLPSMLLRSPKQQRRFFLQRKLRWNHMIQVSSVFRRQRRALLAHTNQEPFKVSQSQLSIRTSLLVEHVPAAHIMTMTSVLQAQHPGS